MHLPTIEMPKAEARQRFEGYRREVRRRHSDEDRAIAAGYKALSKGTPLIRLSEAMKLGGVSRKKTTRAEITVPNLAICRADQPFAWTNGVAENGALTIAGKRSHSMLNKRDVRNFDAGTFEQLEGTTTTWGGWQGNYGLNALTPVVPPPLRPSTSLHGFHILWEAEWKVAPGPPPGDPALLKHIGGDLYAVHAVWDLTELEQAVLAGREFPVE